MSWTWQKTHRQPASCGHSSTVIVPKKDEIDYISKVAKTENEAIVLIEAGFELVCDFDGRKLFKKMKN